MADGSVKHLPCDQCLAVVPFYTHIADGVRERRCSRCHRLLSSWPASPYPGPAYVLNEYVLVKVR